MQKQHTFVTAQPAVLMDFRGDAKVTMIIRTTTTQVVVADPNNTGEQLRFKASSFDGGMWPMGNRNPYRQLRKLRKDENLNILATQLARKA